MTQQGKLFFFSREREREISSLSLSTRHFSPRFVDFLDSDAAARKISLIALCRS